MLVVSAWEEPGVLAKNGVVDKKIFLDRYSWAMPNNWKQVDKLIALARDAGDGRGLAEGFEYIAVLSEDSVQKEPNSYPKGVRRMRLQNPCPVAPLPGAA